MYLILHSTLSQSYSSIFNRTFKQDLIIQAGENENMKEFSLHSFVLECRSQYFLTAFSPGWIMRRNGMIFFKKPNIDPDVFEMVLGFLYEGQVLVAGQPDINILELLIASDELLLDDLFEAVQDYLIRSRSSWIQENLAIVLRRTYTINRSKKLQDHCFNLICKNPKLLLMSRDCLSLDKDILYKLFKRQDLRLEETIAKDYLIKWGIEQFGLGISLNNDDFEQLDGILNDLIPSLDIRPSDFYFHF